MATRKIEADGLAIVLSGDDADPYFCNLSLSDQGSVFLRSVAKNMLTPNAIVFDVGANIGMTTCLMAKINPAATIHAFEPSPNAWPHLQHTIALNSLVGRCVPHNLALGATSGNLAFFDNPVSTAASHLCDGVETLGPTGTKVPVSTIDEQAQALSRLDLIKVDVEGFELDVLDGAKHTIKRFRPFIFVEFNSFSLISYRNQNPRRVAEELSRRFGKVVWRRGATQNVIGRGDSVLDFLHCNLVEQRCVSDLLCIP